MKKKLLATLCCLTMLVGSVSMVNAAYADGKTQGTAAGLYGDVTVEVTVEGEKITAIDLVETNETDAIWNTAWPKVADAIIDAQSTDVDVVSGATFASNAIISFNNGEPDEDTKARIETAFKNKFCGTNNAGSFMLLFNESKDNAAEVTKIQDDNFDKKYDTLSKAVKEDIFIAFRATPTLFGLPNENNGFSKQEYLESFELYNKTVVMPIQKDIERAFKTLGWVIKFKTFVLDNNTINE